MPVRHSPKASGDAGSLRFDTIFKIGLDTQEMQMNSLVFEVECSPEVLDLLYLYKGVHEIHHLLLVLRYVQHLVLHETAHEGSHHSW